MAHYTYLAHSVNVIGPGSVLLFVLLLEIIEKVQVVAPLTHTQRWLEKFSGKACWFFIFCPEMNWLSSGGVRATVFWPYCSCCNNAARFLFWLQLGNIIYCDAVEKFVCSKSKNKGQWCFNRNTIAIRRASKLEINKFRLHLPCTPSTLGYPELWKLRANFSLLFLPFFHHHPRVAFLSFCLIFQFVPVGQKVSSWGIFFLGPGTGE